LENGKAARTRIAVAEQQAGERVSLQRITSPHDLFGGALREMEKTGGRIGLEEIVEELALFTAEFEDVAPVNPGQGRVVGIQGVREAGVRAALVEQGGGVVVHLDYRYAVQPIDLAEDGIAGRGEDGIELRIVFGHRRHRAINGETVGPN